MESIYQSYNANASDKVQIKEYFDRYSSTLRAEQNNPELRDVLDENQLKDLAQRCSIDLLNKDPDYFVPPHHRMSTRFIPKASEINADLGLQTLIDLKTKCMNNDPKVYRSSLKYQSELTVTYKEPIESGPKAVPGLDTLIYVRIYYPFNCFSGEIPRRRQKLSLNNVIAILGCQTLADLRDSLSCISDLSMTTEISENPTQLINIPNKEVYKSSFFYIENTFYNDMRDPSCQDNSAPIREWAKTKKKFGPFYTAKMEETRIDSLTVRFGYPWLFQHQGNCEHLITFSDARLVDANDHLWIFNYPRIQRTKSIKHPICMMCSDNPAVWIVKDADSVPHDSSYFCKECYMSYFYKDGKKIGSFKGYRYPYDPYLVQWIKEKKEEIKTEP